MIDFKLTTRKLKNLIKKKGFDIRDVDYDYVHENSLEDWTAFIDAINPQEGEEILDGCCGYGEVSEKILKKAEENKAKVDLYGIDTEPVQLERMKKAIKDKKLEIDIDHLKICDILDIDFEAGKFDTVVIKMGIHESPKAEQIKIFQEAFRVLKPGGKLVVWELALDNDNQKVFQDVIRKKDELSGFESLVHSRYFPREEELMDLFKEVGFESVVVAYTKIYRPDLVKRAGELVSGEKDKIIQGKGIISAEDEDSLQEISKMKIKEWAEFINQIISGLSDEVKKLLNVRIDNNGNFSFEVKKKFFIAYKPL